VSWIGPGYGALLCLASHRADAQLGSPLLDLTTPLVDEARGRYHECRLDGALVKENAQRKNDLYGIEKFTYDAEANRYLCPAGKTLTYVGVNALNRTHVYASTRKRCRDCPQKAQCTNGRCRIVGVHIHEAARQRAQELAKTPAFLQAQRARRKVEALFAELKNQIGLRRLRLRRMKFVREQFYLAATVQNLKRLVRFLSLKPTEPVATAV